MKNKLNIANYILTVCLFCVFYIFIFDLVCAGRILKFNHIWLNACESAIGNEYLNCIITYDAISLLVILPALFITSYYLFKHYNKYVLLLCPVFGLVLFVLSVITCCGLV